MSFTLEPIVTSDGVVFFDTFKGRGHGFAWQGILGLNLSVSEKAQLSMEYRYLDGPHIQGNHTLDLSLKRYF